MKILILHNGYKDVGGEDGVVRNERDLLRSKGHKIIEMSESNTNIVGLMARLRTALAVHYCALQKERVRFTVAETSPDIVHVHNFFPILTPSVYDAAVERGIPVVQTLHNFRVICPGALLLKDGRVCEKCVGKSAFRAAIHRCYRSSIFGTLAVAHMIEFNRRRGTWRKKVDRFIALTHFSKTRYEKGGIPGHLIAVKPNFTTLEPRCQNRSDRQGALFVGRLSAEKGIDALVSLWGRLPVPLRVVGDGPMRLRLESMGASNVQLVGSLTSEGVSSEMSRAAFLVIPSICYEGFPLTLIEAFAHGLPVLASRLGSLQEIVEEGRTGMLFDPRDAEDVTRKVLWAQEHSEEMRKMGENARVTFFKKYSADVNYKILIDIYESVIEGRNRNNKRTSFGTSY